MSTNKSIGYYPAYCLLLIFVCLYLSALPGLGQVIESKFKHPVYPQPDIYVITNRQADTSEVKFSFTNQVDSDPSLTFMRVNVSSSDSIRLTRLDSTVFVNEITGIKNQNWLLFIHGDSKTFEEAVLRGLNIQNMHKVRVIVFAWPSKKLKINGLKNLRTSYENVKKSSHHFHSVLKTMVGLRNSPTNFLHQKHLSVFLHSLGNNYLEDMVNSDFQLDASPLLFDNVILNAAAVEMENHSKWVEGLQFQNNIFINSNKRDLTLWALRFFTWHGIQLGQKAKLPLARNAVYFNFTKSVGCRIDPRTTHTYFFGKLMDKKENLRLLYYELMHGLQPNLEDKTRFAKRRKSLGEIIVK